MTQTIFKIPVSPDMECLVDEEDFMKLKKYKWTVLKTGHTVYARTYKNGKQVLMHRLIMNPAEKLLVDHINHNGLDNRRANLRVVNKFQNNQNARIAKNNRSGFKGVSYKKSHKSWRVQLMANGTAIHVGYFKSLNSAVAARNEAFLYHHGEYACI